ncbi:GGDEF domain-containing protein [Planctobacterium marinum]|uniref:diguanylate cyclase n=1 Tax=Planctobacterium marinum TaxID=1631968 RepID=A0AA48KPQ9_9ALTE|nr:hypothetical protein MACH26_24220 [Planctobacterium marinum]
MAVRFFHWLDESISRKIGGLSTVLLTFILALVLYSIVQLREISQEIQELAQIDVPVSELAAEIEVLQLEQHILMERLHYELRLSDEKNFQSQKLMQEKFADYSVRLKDNIHALTRLIKDGLEQGKIVKEVPAHQAVIAAFAQFETARDEFHHNASKVLQNDAHLVSEQEWQELEKQDQALDQHSLKVLREIESITADISAQAEEHERRFYYVNTGLGISAFIIGINVTLLIIISFRRRMRHINSQIDNLYKSITGKQDAINADELSPQGRDELAKLAKDINRLMSQYSEAVVHRDGIEEALIRQATTDNLTGAHNRYKWDEAAKALLVKTKSGITSSIILLDIDNFKNINDQHGHNVGDKVLQNLVNDINELIRQSDLVFRMGGEEFTVLLQGCDLQKAAAIAENIRAELQVAPRNEIPQFTASFGVTELRSHDSLESLLERADKALYQAKAQGKNQVCIASND